MSKGSEARLSTAPTPRRDSATSQADRRSRRPREHDCGHVGNIRRPLLCEPSVCAFDRVFVTGLIGFFEGSFRKICRETGTVSHGRSDRAGIDPPGPSGFCSETSKSAAWLIALRSGSGVSTSAAANWITASSLSLPIGLLSLACQSAGRRNQTLVLFERFVVNLFSGLQSDI